MKKKRIFGFLFTLPQRGRRGGGLRMKSSKKQKEEEGRVNLAQPLIFYELNVASLYGAY